MKVKTKCLYTANAAAAAAAAAATTSEQSLTPSPPLPRMHTHAHRATAYRQKCARCISNAACVRGTFLFARHLDPNMHATRTHARTHARTHRTHRTHRTARTHAHTSLVEMSSASWDGSVGASLSMRACVSACVRARAVRCGAVRCGAVRAVRCGAVRRGAMPCSAVRCGRACGRTGARFCVHVGGQVACMHAPLGQCQQLGRRF